MHETKIKLGMTLKSFREAKGITKYSVMKKCGFATYSPIEAIERGATSYTVDNLLRYCDAVGAEISVNNPKSFCNVTE